MVFVCVYGCVYVRVSYGVVELSHGACDTGALWYVSQVYDAFDGLSLTTLTIQDTLLYTNTELNGTRLLETLTAQGSSTLRHDWYECQFFCIASSFSCSCLWKFEGWRSQTVGLVGGRGGILAASWSVFPAPSWQRVVLWLVCSPVLSSALVSTLFFALLGVGGSCSCRFL